jgi:hypothetical protein
MGKLENALDAELGPGVKPSVVCKGTSAGLNGASNANRTDAMLYIIPGRGVLFARVKLGIGSKVIVERFPIPQLMQVSEGEAGRTGIDAWSAERNRRLPGMSAIGAMSVNEPVLTLMTRRGDVIFAFKHKEKGLLRQAYLAIAEVIEQGPTVQATVASAPASSIDQVFDLLRKFAGELSHYGSPDATELAQVVGELGQELAAPAPRKTRLEILASGLAKAVSGAGALSVLAIQIEQAIHGL